MMRFLILLFLALPLAADTTVTLLHFSDYHSHPEGLPRAMGFLRAEKRKGAIVFSGGDTMNKGAPAWSDKYQCAEWPWWNGVVDAMAFGNHDADYGAAAFERCKASVRYPILSANTSGFRRYAVIARGKVRIGVFAVAGPDFTSLVKGTGMTFGDPIAAAHEVVRDLREKESVDAVVMIGHQHTEDDYKLARAVPGIDVIFGSHSHLASGVMKIEGTKTSFIAPGQYLEFVSRIELTIAEGRVKSVKGGLLPVDERMPVHRLTARRVARMQRDLERDPQYASLFVPIGRLAAPLTVEQLAERALHVMRDVTKADGAISTTSSFRRPLRAGTLTLEALRDAMPYDNAIVVCRIDAAQWERLRAESYVVGKPGERVATTDYLAGKEKLQCETTGLRVREELKRVIPSEVEGSPASRR
jgi:5'-nucleotidase